MRADMFAVHFGLSPTEAAILAVLHRAGCSWVSLERLNEATAPASHLFDHAAPNRNPRALYPIICSLRAKLPADAILSKWGEGYTLGAAGVLACRRALAEQVAA